VKNYFALILSAAAITYAVHYSAHQFEEIKAAAYMEGAKDGALLGYKLGVEETLKEGSCI
jgi:hypothetical protein